MSDARIAFDVEEAGCESCGRLVRGALGAVATVETVDIDEAADRASVVLAGDVTRSSVDAALARASADAGHRYRVREGSWRALTDTL